MLFGGGAWPRLASARPQSSYAAQLMNVLICVTVDTAPHG